MSALLLVALVLGVVLLLGPAVAVVLGRSIANADDHELRAFERARDVTGRLS